MELRQTLELSQKDFEVIKRNLWRYHIELTEIFQKELVKLSDKNLRVVTKGL